MNISRSPQRARRGFAAGLAGAFALAMLPAVVHAQSHVTIYGLMDLGVEHLTGVAGGGTLTRMPGFTGSVPSRLGFRGTEDLGGGLSATFVMESGLFPDTGTFNQGGRFFGRQSWLGLSGSFGSVMLGRQYTMLALGMVDADIMGPNAYAPSSLDPYIANARVDNALGYVGAFGNFKVGATYSFGRDTVNAGPSPGGTNCPGESASNSNECKEWSVLAQYQNATWGVSGVIDHQRGGPGAFGGLTSSAMSDQRSLVSGFYKFGTVKVGAGLLHRNNQASTTTPRSDLGFLGVSVPVWSAVTLEAQVQRLDFKDSPNAATLLSGRALYALSKRTALYVTVGHIRNKGTLAAGSSGGQPPAGAPGPGGSQTGITTGIRHFF
ncbi:MAG: porin [Pseudomonadota bacterium]